MGGILVIYLDLSKKAFLLLEMLSFGLIVWSVDLLKSNFCVGFLLELLDSKVLGDEPGFLKLSFLAENKDELSICDELLKDSSYFVRANEFSVLLLINELFWFLVKPYDNRFVLK